MILHVYNCSKIHRIGYGEQYLFKLLGSFGRDLFMLNLCLPTKCISRRQSSAQMKKLSRSGLQILKCALETASKRGKTIALWKFYCSLFTSEQYFGFRDTSFNYFVTKISLESFTFCLFIFFRSRRAKDPREFSGRTSHRARPNQRHREPHQLAETQQTKTGTPSLCNITT